MLVRIWALNMEMVCLLYSMSLNSKTEIISIRIMSTFQHNARNSILLQQRLNGNWVGGIQNCALRVSPNAEYTSMPGAHSLCFLLQVSSSIMRCGTAQKYKLIIPGWSPASWDPETALRFERGCFRFIVVREACDSAFVENAPHLDSPDEANKLRARRSKPACPGCALMEGALWFSQLLFLGQFHQRRQAEDNRQFDYRKAKWYSVCGFANKRHWSCCWSPQQGRS